MILLSKSREYFFKRLCKRFFCKKIQTTQYYNKTLDLYDFNLNTSSRYKELENILKEKEDKKYEKYNKAAENYESKYNCDTNEKKGRWKMLMFTDLEKMSKIDFELTNLINKNRFGINYLQVLSAQLSIDIRNKRLVMEKELLYSFTLRRMKLFMINKIINKVEEIKHIRYENMEDYISFVVLLNQLMKNKIHGKVVVKDLTQYIYDKFER